MAGAVVVCIDEASPVVCVSAVHCVAQLCFYSAS